MQREGRYWDRGRVLAFEPHLSQGTLGRSLSCNWRLNDPSVSRLHAALIRKHGAGPVGVVSRRAKASASSASLRCGSKTDRMVRAGLRSIQRDVAAN